MTKPVELSIIIVSFNTKKLLVNCINSIRKNVKNLEYEVIVIDNASTDGSVQAVINQQRQDPDIKLIGNRRNLGFGTANNQGMKIAKGKYILLLNSDTLILDGVLGEMVTWMRKHPDVGIASCALKNEDGSMQGTGGYFPTLIRVFSWMTIQDLPFVDKFIKPFHPMHAKSFQKGTKFFNSDKELDWLTGAFLLIRTEVIDKIGYFDKDYFMYVEETDYCYRAKRVGWKIYYLPKWSIVHYGGLSGKREEVILAEYKGIKTFYKKHYPSWQFPILRLFLKIGALGRMILFGILEGKYAIKTYVKAFQIA